MAHLWTIYGPYMGHIWAIHGPYMGHKWAIYGPYLGRIWSIYGPKNWPYVCHIWPIYGPSSMSMYFSQGAAIRSQKASAQLKLEAMMRQPDTEVSMPAAPGHRAACALALTLHMYQAAWPYMAHIWSIYGPYMTIYGPNR